MKWECTLDISIKILEGTNMISIYDFDISNIEKDIEEERKRQETIKHNEEKRKYRIRKRLFVVAAVFAGIITG